MDRRKFLQSLAILGSSTALPSHAHNDTSFSSDALPAPATLATEDCDLLNSKPDEFIEKIGVIAIGGAGGAIVSRLAAGLPYLDRAIAIDTNPFALHQLTADRKILVGNGKRTPYEPSILRSVARQVSDEVTNAASGLQLALVLSGMGGVTGTAISPIVAETLRRMDIPALGIVTTPFDFEGQRCMQVAQNGLDALSHYATTVLPISNEVLSRNTGENALLAAVLDRTQLTFEKLYRNIANVAGGNSLVGIDLEDVRVVLNEGRRSAFGFASANGIDNVEYATQHAIFSPLLGQNDLRLASGVLVAVEGKPEFVKLRQINRAFNIIRQYVSPTAHLLVSATIANHAEDFSISILATGLPGTSIQI